MDARGSRSPHATSHLLRAGPQALLTLVWLDPPRPSSPSTAVPTLLSLEGLCKTWPQLLPGGWQSLKRTSSS